MAAFALMSAIALPTMATTERAFAAQSCFQVGQNYANSVGASLAAAEDATKNGAAVCKVVVLVQSSDGSRPKREVVYLPR